MIRFQCPACGAMLESSPSNATVQSACPGCGGPLQVPGLLSSYTTGEAILHGASVGTAGALCMILPFRQGMSPLGAACLLFFGALAGAVLWGHFTWFRESVRSNRRWKEYNRRLPRL